jgi:hypothetical protein
MKKVLVSILISLTQTPALFAAVQSHEPLHPVVAQTHSIPPAEEAPVLDEIVPGFTFSTPDTLNIKVFDRQGNLVQKQQIRLSEFLVRNSMAEFVPRNCVFVFFRQNTAYYFLDQE